MLELLEHILLTHLISFRSTFALNRAGTHRGGADVSFTSSRVRLRAVRRRPVLGGTRCCVAPLDRPLSGRNVRRRQSEVLFEHVPALVAAGLECTDRVGDRRVSLAERSEECLLHGCDERELPGPKPVGNRFVDVLQVHVGDSVTSFTGQPHGVGAAERQVPGVEAEEGVASLEQP